MGQRRKVLKASRTAAKVGMGASMAVLVYTGFEGGRRAMHLHTWAGMALLGFTLLHVYLYQPRRVPAAKRQIQATGSKMARLSGLQAQAKAKAA